ncbi:hypothetical protein BC351_10440 [Paenibacillus ferrarius]|uniref:Uncharacterized protein n=1 Tax=Paenibacillus ferrarius TaxID=1469647 RepID=A0A1V4H8X5_9BACL|nr:hypothetical protein [Paenibacillus ferrarius]OPH47601.1 hypothetical protein BC351_10440 [Paenibacillus ferrarius]
MNDYKDDLRQVVINYRDEPLSGDKVHVIARVNGKETINNYYQVYASVETNYSRIYFVWDEDGVIPAEFQEHYPNSSNRYPVSFSYFENEDILHLEGNYFGKSYKLVVQLPPKRPI